jgi:LytR cell envelope-related transcriptional attenuator
MAEGTVRRPLPALIALLALTLLTALVWWRVLNRGGSSHPTSCSGATAVVVLPQPSSVSLSVYNSTNRSGLAKAAAKVLTADGFKVLSWQNDPANQVIQGVAEIRYSLDQKTNATLVAYYFPGAKLVQYQAETESKLVVSLGTKFVKVTSPQDVRTALDQSHQSQAPSGQRSTPVPSSSASC